MNGLCEDATQFCLDNNTTPITTTTSTTTTTTSATTTSTTTTSTTTSTTTTSTTSTTTTTTTIAANVEIVDAASCWGACFGSGKYFYDPIYGLS